MVYVHVYLITNRVNGKVYVGQTVKTIHRRWNDHQSASKCGAKQYFAKAIIKHGANSFTVELLETCSDADELDAAEIRWIAHYDSMNSSKGYNMTVGGEGAAVRGENNGTAIFTWEQVRAVRAEFAAGQISRKQLAAKHNASQTCIAQIISGKTWFEPGLPIYPKHKTLTEEEIQEVRDEYALGNISFRELGERYGITTSGIRGIVARERRAGVKVGAVHKNTVVRLTWEQVREIRAAYEAGVKTAELRERYGVWRSTVNDIVHGRTWKEEIGR